MNDSFTNHDFKFSTLLRWGLLLVLLGMAIWPLPIQASPTATINVNTTNDELNSDGDCSLREAIEAANTNAEVDACTAGSGADTITFDAVVDGIPIILTGAASENANASGDLDILDYADLTIQGNGASKTIIDGGGIDRVFHICPDGGCDINVTFNRITIRNGSVIGGGGGILNNDATLNVQDSTIGGVGFGNVALYAGGGIANLGGMTTLDGSIVSDNVAAGGGGIANYGGTLHVQNGSLIGGADAGNQASFGGGGISNEAGTTIVDGSTVSGNSCFDYDCKGGGISNSDTLTVQNGSTVGEVGAPNQAHYGGGIYNVEGTTNVYSSTVSANTADYKGGGIFNEDGRTTVDNSIVGDNTADYGGGIYNKAILNVVNGSIIGGVGAGNTALWSGGGIYNIEEGNTTVDGSAVSDNVANCGGGVYNIGTLMVQNNSIISGNTALGTEVEEGGGGIYNEDGTTTIDGSTISANTATLFGGGIFNTFGTFGTGTITLDASNVSANEAIGGGGIMNEAILYILNGSTISANTAAAGGGIYNSYDTVTVTGSRILNNTASTNGGGIYNQEDTDVTGSCIVGNSDMSFFSTEEQPQNAKGNWWGAAAGPNTHGADTTGGNVDASDFLTAPILDCAPDLQVNKTNDTGGEGTVGTPFHWTLTISNSGLLSATFEAEQTILQDDLPVGPKYGAPVAGHFVDVTNSAEINCTITDDTLTCEAVGADITIGAGGSFMVAFSVTPSDVGMLSNPAGICEVDPNGYNLEGDEDNNSCLPDSVYISVTTFYQYLPLVSMEIPSGP